MNGPEHYRMAERLLRTCRLNDPEIYEEGGEPVFYYPPDHPVSLDDHVVNPPNNLVAAQVHATLALAAATADPMLGHRPGLDKEWQEAIQ